jgi:hypothetical protein
MSKIIVFAIFGSTLPLCLLPSCSDSTSPIDQLSGGAQRTWKISNRSENGGAPGVPICAKDDLLIF